jgi:hypothetical protein
MLLSICNSNKLLKKHEKHILIYFPNFPYFVQRNHANCMFVCVRFSLLRNIRRANFAMFWVSQNKTIRKKRTVAVMCDESLFPVVRLQTLLASLGTRNANKETLQRSRLNNSVMHY